MKKIFALLLVALLTFGLAACGGGDDEVPPEIIDCLTNPEGEGCPDINPDPEDNRTAEEILADFVKDNWDGELTHLSLLMENMDLDTSAELITEFNLEFTDDGETHFINAIITDNFVEGVNGTLMHRNITVNFDGDIFYIDFIFEEVATGVIVYINIEDIKDRLATEDQEVLDILDTVGATEDWLMFSFDDSLENIIELEIAKDMIIDVFFAEMGETFFYDLQAELDLELEVTLSDYGIDIGAFVDHIADGEYEDAETMIDGILIEDLIFDLDAIHLVPEIVALLTENQVELDLALFDTTGRIAYITANGTEALLDDLTDAEVSILLDVLVDANAEPGDLDLSDVYDHYVLGDLDHYMIMMFLDDPDVELGLKDIPGLDFDVLYAAMDALDYDAFYLEEMDMELFADAVYEGQAAFDIFVTGLETTAPETASILEAFSGVVLELEVFKSVVDDINYALDNLFVFEQYFEMDYYLDNDIVTMGIDKTLDFEIETTMVIEGPEFAQLFVDVLDEAYWFLDGFESFEMPYVQYVNCPAGETCEDFDEYLDIIDGFGDLGNVEITALYDPSNPDEMTTVVDATNFINALIQMDEYATGVVNDLSITVTMSEDGDVNIPTETSDVNEIAQDFARFSLNLMAYDFVREALEYYVENPGEFALGNHALDTYDNMNPSLAFDSNMSFITLGGSVLNPTIECTLYWADGTLVFNSPVTLAALEAQLDSGVPSATIYQTLLANVNETNFNMTKFLIIFVFQDDGHDDYEEEYYPEY